MLVSEILDRIRNGAGVEPEIVWAAAAHKDEIAPALMDIIERFLAEPTDSDRSIGDSVYWSFYMLGEYRWRPAYRLMARLLELPADRIDHVLGEEAFILAPRVMANVFDGDPAPLYAIIEDEWGSDALREGLFATLVMAVRNGTLDRDVLGSWLRECYGRLQPQDEPSTMWFGWQKAIGVLGLTDLVPLVRAATDRGLVLGEYMSLDEFTAGMEEAQEKGGDPWWIDADEYTEFGSAVDEIETLNDEIDDALEDLLVQELEDLALEEDGLPLFLEEHLQRAAEAAEKFAEGLERQQVGREPAWTDDDFGAQETTSFNPYRDVGRNDLCPCGSGKKYKKCCLH